MRKIAFVNEKGGTGKTTLVVNVGSYLALKKKKQVLLVDLDPQGQVGKSLGINVREQPVTILELLTQPDLPLKEAILPTKIENLKIIASNKNLVDFFITAATLPDRNLLLRNRLKELQGFDYVIFDSPPSMGLFTLNALVASDEVIVPVALTYLSLDGCAEIVETVDLVRSRLSPLTKDLRISMFVATFWRNTLLAEAIHEKLKEHFKERVAKTIIGYSVKIDEAQSHGQTIWEYDPASKGALMIGSLAEEIYRKK